MGIGNSRRAVGLLVLAACVLVLSQCIVLERRPGPPGQPPQRHAPPYAAGRVFVVTGMVQANGPGFLLNDDASDFVFQLTGVRMDERVALQRATGRHITLQLRIIDQRGPRVLVADVLRIVR
jgi:hypothetical protein